MKSSFLFYLILLFDSSFAQTKSQTKKMEKFNISQFMSLAVNSEYTQILKDGTVINQFQSLDGFTETVIPVKGWFYEYRDYFLNGILKEKGKYFLYGNYKSGTWMKFDEDGHLLNKINYDTPYKMSLDDVFAITKERKILFSKENTINTIKRDIVDGKPFWFVEWQETYGRIEVLKIDDVSGKVVSQGFYNFESDH
jgi:hypothetical protein